MRSNEPPRLRLDAGAPHLLRIALDANDDEPTGSDLDALAAGLGFSLIPAPLPLSTAASTFKSGAIAAAKSKLISCIVLPAFLGAATATAVLKAADPGQRPSVAAGEEVESVVPPAAKTTPNSPVLAPSPDPVVESKPLPSIPAAASVKPTPATRERDVPPPVDMALAPTPSVDPPPAVESEVALLERAKALVPTDPEKALVLVAEHGSRFPSGMLEQEAEVIAIESLVQAGHTSSAIDRLAQFRRRFERSAYLPHLETVVRLRK